MFNNNPLKGLVNFFLETNFQEVVFFTVIALAVGFTVWTAKNFFQDVIFRKS